MAVTDSLLEAEDKAYKPARSAVVIVRREVNITYKKSYGGMSPYIQGIMGAGNGKLFYTVCENEEGHDAANTLRFQIPRADCPECYAKTLWKKLPGTTQFFIETLSTAVELAGITFMNQLPVTVAWIKAVLPDSNKTALATLSAGMLSSGDYFRLKKGDELRPVFRAEPQASASDVMWVLKGTPPDRFPRGYIQSRNYNV